MEHPVKTMLLRALALIALAATAVAQPTSRPRPDAPPKPLYPNAAPVCSPEDLRKVSIPNTTIDSVTVEAAEGSCRIVATVTHPPASDHVKVFVALPLKNWNGRFRGNGGGGFTGGNVGSLSGPVKQGFAVAVTDTGHEGGSGSFALNASGRLNWQEIRDNAYLGIHEMTVVSKALAQAFYGKPPKYSYFFGSSTGGRQGLSEAQRYPEDYDGIFSGCPAVNWHKFVACDFWPQVVMLEAKNWVSKAKLDAVTTAVVAAWDGRDGVVDGIIDDPVRCTWDPGAFVGTKVGNDTFTAADAEVVRTLWRGPHGHDGRRLWYPFMRGANLAALAGTEGSPLTGKPFAVALDWLKYFLAQNAQWDWTTLTSAEFELLWNQAVEQYGPVIGTDNPDLTRFRDRGGKVIITHGLADQLIPHEGSIEYYERVQKQMGGAERTAAFARLFLVPGVDHGFRGPGGSPIGLQDAIIRWVEEGKAPDELRAELRDQGGKLIRSRLLFPYPYSAKYKGTGNPDDAANFARASPQK
jgi:feruloyl esterase